MKIESCLVKAQNRLRSITDRPLLESEILLSFTLGQSREYLHKNSNDNLGEFEEREFFKLVQRREASEPIEYIVKRVSFYSYDFYVDNRVLIPRPETEILIDKVVNLKLNSIKNIAEVGVGSGIISIMLKKLIKKDINITGTDISSEAVEVAKINAKKHAVKIDFENRNLLDGIDREFDLIVSNPPYIAKSFKIDKNLEYEPQNALFAEDNGLEIIKKLIDVAIEKEVKYLVCEIGYDQREAIEEYLKDKSIDSIEFYKDLASFDRGFVISF